MHRLEMLLLTYRSNHTLNTRACKPAN